jgi:hypothetical protein
MDASAVPARAHMLCLRSRSMKTLSSSDWSELPGKSCSMKKHVKGDGQRGIMRPTTTEHNEDNNVEAHLAPSLHMHGRSGSGTGRS